MASGPVWEVAVEQEYVSRYKGVRWDGSTQKWMARSTHNGRRIYLGLFPTQEDAAAAIVVFREANPKCRPSPRWISAVCCYDDDQPWFEIQAGPEWVKVDRADRNLVVGYNWHLSRRDGHGYAFRIEGAGRGRRRSVVHMSRAIMGLSPDDPREVDHKNRDPLDNRRENLRIGSHQNNVVNRTKSQGKSSRYRGVSWSPREKKWRAYIVIDNRQRHLGYFDPDCEIDAARAYDQAALAAWGEWANPNRV
jgi:hypothetical protein